MRTFFDPTLVERWGAAFLQENKLDEALCRLIPNARITKGHYSYPVQSELRDLVWNHMDQNHRPFLHRTYGDAMRMHIGEEAAFSLTRIGNWPVVVPVFDGYYKENGFYQVISLFGLVVIVNQIEACATPDGTRMEIDWAIASSRWLRFLHPLLDRRLRRLNDVQNAEDEVVRQQRVALRAEGYRFLTDRPDFLNSNAIGNNVVFPPVTGVHTLSVADLSDGDVRRMEIAQRAYLVRRSGSEIHVWPAICPHEGAPLEPRHVGGNGIKCPWHGLEFGMRPLRSGGAPVTVCGARLALYGTTLKISAVGT